MCGDAGKRADGKRCAEKVGRVLDTDAGHVGQAVVERRHVVPEIPFGAADAWMAGTDRPARARVPHEDRTGRERLRSFASDFVEAVAFARAFVVKRTHELPGVVVRALGALIVDAILV